MRRALGVLALTILPVAAEAAAFAVKNCSASMATVIAFERVGNTSAAQAQISPGGSAIVSCSGEACWLQVVYFGSGGAASVGVFPGPYSTDRCTRGPIDAAGGDLPAAGTCGC